ncbi:hypothetical protein ANAPC1_01206 [Anaplasma phagocytophilum]|uniref:Uncharacterized protein n=1 Tax=Anaplasma phagocytophilum TaxID=948 RepID=A0AA45UUQ5_ANAPH|nr:hypothetical protein ANAPC1_01206 [Anaplasma phagocytophilum]
MMLLLGRLITLPLLLPKHPVKTSFSLRMLLKFLILPLMGRFVIKVMRKALGIVVLQRTARA